MGDRVTSGATGGGGAVVSKATLLALLLAAAGCESAVERDRRIGAERAEETKLSAVVACNHFAREALKAPSTATFATHLEQSALWVTEAPPQLEISSHVDAHNGFGAMIRTRYRCHVAHEGVQGAGRWKLIDLTFES